MRIGCWVGEMVEILHKLGFRAGEGFFWGEIGENVGNRHYRSEEVVENVELWTSGTGNIQQW